METSEQVPLVLGHQRTLFRQIFEPRFEMDEKDRLALAKTAIKLNVPMFFSALALLAISMYLKFGMETRWDLIISRSGILSYFLIVIACFWILVELATVKILFDFTEKGTTQGADWQVGIMLWCQGLILMLLIISVILCIVHQYIIKDILHDDILDAVKLYRDDENVKTALDNIQMQYHCCGSDSFEDWFKYSWIPLRYVNYSDNRIVRHITGGEIIKDDVPYSCCDVEVIHPCIHVNIREQTATLGAQAVMRTLYTTGCTEILALYWREELLMPTIIIMFGVILWQVGVVITSRLLQTSLNAAMELEDPIGETTAYLWVWCCKEDVIEYSLDHLGKITVVSRKILRDPTSPRTKRNLKVQFNVDRTISQEEEIARERKKLISNRKKKKLLWEEKARKKTDQNSGESKSTLTSILDFVRVFQNKNEVESKDSEGGENSRKKHNNREKSKIRKQIKSSENDEMHIQDTKQVQDKTMSKWRKKKKKRKLEPEWEPLT